MYIRAVHSWEQMRTTKTNKCESCISYGSMDNKMVTCQYVKLWTMVGAQREKEKSTFLTFTRDQLLGECQREINLLNIHNSIAIYEMWPSPYDVNAIQFDKIRTHKFLPRWMQLSW